jgi:hypothetical protein
MVRYLSCASIGIVFKMKMLVTTTQDNRFCTCLGHLGHCNTDRIISILFCATKGGQGKYSNVCRMLLLLIVSLTNFVNVNDPLLKYYSLKDLK